MIEALSGRVIDGLIIVSVTSGIAIMSWIAKLTYNWSRQITHELVEIAKRLTVASVNDEYIIEALKDLRKDVDRLDKEVHKVKERKQL